MPPSNKPAVIEALTEEQIDTIAERAAEKAVEKLTDHIYMEVGRGVIKRIAYVCGAFVIGVVLWAKKQGWL